MAILTLGIDLAKNVFAVHGVNETGAAQLRQPKVARGYWVRSCLLPPNPSPTASATANNRLMRDADSCDFLASVVIKRQDLTPRFSDPIRRGLNREPFAARCVDGLACAAMRVTAAAK